MNCKNFGGKVLPFLLTFLLFFANIFMSFSQITFTTNKNIGDKVTLKINSINDVTFEGLSGTYKKNQNTEYTITNKTIKIIGNVHYLSCSNNEITSLNVSEAPLLSYLICDNNKITELDLSKNPKITSLNISSNEISSIDLSKQTSLKWFTCSNNKIENINFGEGVSLLKLVCDNNKLTSLNIRNHNNIDELNCSNNKITDLDLRPNSKIRILECNNNQITRIRLTSTIIKTFKAYNNNLNATAISKVIDLLPNVSGGEARNFVCIDKTSATEANAINAETLQKAQEKGWKLYDHNGGKDESGRNSELGKLFSLDREANITFTTNKNIGETIELKITPKEGESITIEGVDEEYSEDNTTYTLTKSEVKIFGQVEGFECLNNGITSLDLSKNIELTDLDCSNNELTELNLSKNTKLSTLYCYQNNLSALDLRANTEIIALYCGDNKLTSIDLSQNQMLISLSLWGNKITNLDLSHNKSISELECYSNEISELTLADDLNITNILLFGNKLSKAAMQKIIDKLPTINISDDEKDSKGFFVAVNKKDSEESNFISERQVKKLTDKGWRVRDYNEGVNDSGEESEFGIPFGGDTDAEENANIIFTTNKAIGETIELKITPKEGENIRIEGVEESYNLDEETATYTLTGSEVRIFGQVESFDCIENGITSLDISKNTELVDLDCSNNELTELDLSKNIKLSTLYCQKNKLKNLNLFRNTELTILFCADNELANIDLVSNRMLNIVSISSNKLTSLDLSRQSELKELYCNANKLTDITLADNSKTSSISLFSNKLSKASMQKFIDKLPTISISDNEKYTKGFFVVVNKQNREEANFISKGQVKALAKKGWRVRDYNNGFSDKGEESEFGIAFEGEEDPTEKDEETTTISEVSTSSVSIYPNPATSYLIVKGLAGNSIAKLYNIAGELVLETIVSDDTRIDLSKLPSARYILVVDGKAHQILINK